jgi:hypothetical protein
MHPHPLQNRQKIDNLGESQCRMGPVPLQISPSLVRISAKRCQFRYILRDPCFHLQIVAGSAAFRYMYHMVNSSLLIGQPGPPAPRQGLAGAKSPRFSILYRHNARRPPTYWFVSNVRAGPHCKAAVKLRASVRHRYRYIVENRVPLLPRSTPYNLSDAGACDEALSTISMICCLQTRTHESQAETAALDSSCSLTKHARTTVRPRRLGKK